MVVDQLGTGLSEAEVDRLFRALADATRRDIVRRTLLGDASVSELASAYAMSFAAVQKHVAVLEEAGLVVKRTQGRQRLVSADPDRIAHARRLLSSLEELWRARFAQLDAVLADPVPTDHASTDHAPTDPAPTDHAPTDPARTPPTEEEPCP